MRLTLNYKRKAQTFANAFKVHHKPQYNRLEPALIVHTLNMYCFALNFPRWWFWRLLSKYFKMSWRSYTVTTKLNRIFSYSKYSAKFSLANIAPNWRKIVYNYLYVLSFSQFTYYKLMRKIVNGIEKTNTVGGQFIMRIPIIAAFKII